MYSSQHKVSSLDVAGKRLKALPGTEEGIILVYHFCWLSEVLPLCLKRVLFNSDWKGLVESSIKAAFKGKINNKYQAP